MDLRAWIIGEHEAVAARFDQAIVATVPADQWRDPAGDGGSSIAWLAFHTTYHEDVAVNAVVRCDQPLLNERRRALGLEGLTADAGLGEAEQPELTARLAIDELRSYVRAVHDRTATWLATVDLDGIDSVPPSADGLRAAGVEETAVPWLYGMWSGKPTSWLVQWEAIGHRVNHLGEMVSVRNRLGRSPF